MMSSKNENKHLNLLCNHFKSGTCNFGASCLFSHDPDSSIPIPEDVCIFYLKGNCLRADNCLYKHLTVNELLDENSEPSIDPDRVRPILVDYRSYDKDDDDKDAEVKC